MSSISNNFSVSDGDSHSLEFLSSGEHVESNPNLSPLTRETKPTYIHEQHNTNCQQFFGPLYGCVFAMPGSNVTPPTINESRLKTHDTQHTSKKPRTKKPSTDFIPLNVTFTRKRGLMDEHLALMLNIIQQEQWIMPESNPDSFIDLFSGKESDCRIIWNPEVGKGILRDLIKMMIAGGFIQCPDGYGYVQVIESHFVYPDGQFVRGLKGGYTSEKAKNTIDKCRKILLLNPHASNYSDAEEIRSMFSDIRYEP